MFPVPFCQSQRLLGEISGKVWLIVRVWSRSTPRGASLRRWAHLKGSILSPDMSPHPKKATFSQPGRAFSQRKQVRNPRVISKVFVLLPSFDYSTLSCVNFKQPSWSRAAEEGKIEGYTDIMGYFSLSVLTREGIPSFLSANTCYGFKSSCLCLRSNQLKSKNCEKKIWDNHLVNILSPLFTDHGEYDYNFTASF